MKCGRGKEDGNSCAQVEKKIDAAALRESILLYAVTDRTWLGGATLAEQVSATLEGGATFIQLREKDLKDEDFLKEALKIKELTDKYQVPFVINDNVAVAIKCGADGVHVGQSDMHTEKVRSTLGPHKIIGVSVCTVEQAIQAEKEGADYIGVGAVFSTNTKIDADTVSYEKLKEICAAVTIPVVAIGGITKENISALSGSGIDGVAIVSAIFGMEDIEGATRELVELSKKMVG
jgi:thiamine-phosphate pyrophosphorylase